MKLFSEKFSTTISPPLETKRTISREMVACSITEFHYSLATKSTFCTQFSQFEDLFQVEFKEQVDDWKVRLLLRKLKHSEHDWYINNILPKHPCDCNFDV